MENPQKKINIDEDRLSNLPGDVIERVMDLLPVRDAARTCVLSSKWRYVWADHPSLVLDTDFWTHIQHNKSDNIHIANIVNSILLHHVGHIQRFFIDISAANVSSNSMDSCLSSLCSRRSLKVFHLINSGGSNGYKVPFGSVLLPSQLTDLSLSSCYIKDAVGCFTNIQSLHLEDAVLDSVVLTTPLLTSLCIKGCFCKSGFHISAPKLSSLTLEYSAFLDLKTFFTCTDIEYAVLLSDGPPFLVQADGKHMLDLLALWPRISVLAVDGHCFKVLTTESTPVDNYDMHPLNLRHFVVGEVDLDSERMSWVVYILKNSPMLHTFGIWFGEDLMNDIDDEPMDLKMDQLRTVIMKDFTASRIQVKFVEILLKGAPLLEILRVKEDEKLGVDERMKISKGLSLLQRINPKTEIIFA